MKKFLFMVAMALVATVASAQVEAGFRQGVQVNVGASNVTGFDGDKMAFSYGLGWVAEYNFSPSVYVQSGLGLQNVAHKEEGIDGTINAFYLQLPIHIGGRYNLSDNTSLFAQAGPTIACGLFGSNIDFYGGDSYSYFGDIAKRFDLGLGARIGAEFTGIKVSAGVDYGVLKVTEIGGHNFCFNVGFAYMF